MEKGNLLTFGFYHLTKYDMTVQKEQILWKFGIKSWDQLLSLQYEVHKHNPKQFPKSLLKKLNQGISESKEQLKSKNYQYFYTLFKEWDLPRLFQCFERPAFMSVKQCQGQMVVVVIFDGTQLKEYIKGISLIQLKVDIHQYDAIYGLCPEEYKHVKEYCEIKQNQIFFNFRGQLKRKNISQFYGNTLQRFHLDSPAYNHLTFKNQSFIYESLWKKHLSGDCSSLPTLLTIAAEEAVHMSYLRMWIFNELLRRSDAQLQIRQQLNKQVLGNYFNSDVEMLKKLAFEFSTLPNKK